MMILDAFRRIELRLPDRAEPGATVLSVEGVSVAYGAVPVLSDIDLAVRAGEIVALVGPNGAGKSTLLAAITGDVATSTGTVRIDGEPLDHWTFAELAVRRGVLLQQVDVSFPFSVTEVVRMGRAPWVGTDADLWDDEVVGQAIVDVDLVQLADRVYQSLSGGSGPGRRWRRCWPRTPGSSSSTSRPPPSTSATRSCCSSWCGRAAARGDAVVIVLHDLDLAAAYADRVVILSDGRTTAIGPPAEVFTSELLSAVYQYPIDVVRRPGRGEILVVPDRRRPRPDPSPEERSTPS